MARKVKKRASGGTSRQRPRLDRDKRLETVLIWGVVLVGIAVVGVLGYGLVVKKVIEPREPVAVVGDTPVRTSEFQARVRFTRLQMQKQLRQLYQQQQKIDPQDPKAQSYQKYIQRQIQDLRSRLAPENAESIGKRTLNQLIQEELVRQEADTRGVSVASSEVEERIQGFFGYEPNAAPEPTPLPSSISTEVPEATPLPTPTQMTEVDFRRMYNEYLRALRQLGISEQQYRAWLKAALLTEKLQDDMMKELPTEADQVKLRILTANSEKRAKELAAQLNAGTDFQTLADQLKEDKQTTGYGDELSWLPKELLESRLGEELADLAFSLEVGEHSQPVAGEEGQYTVIQVAGHEVRELDELVRQRTAEDAFKAWLDAQQVKVERKSYRDRVPTEPGL